MGNKAWLIITLLIMVSLFAAMRVVLAHAQSSADYDLTWFSINSGGGVSASGAYCIGGSVGQPEAGSLSGGSYMLVGGFWGGTGPVSAPLHYTIYLPLVLRGG